MARKHPGVESLGEGRYRLRARVQHPKTGKWGELDRIVMAESAAEAARLRESVRAEWISKRSRAVERDARRTLGDAIDAWLEDKTRDVKRSTASQYKSCAAWWKKVLGEYLLDAVEPSDVREALAGAVVGDETKAGRLRVLRTFAAEERCSSIVEGVRVKRTVRDEERQEDEGRGFSIEELRKILEKGPSAWLTKKGEVNDAWTRAWALIATLLWTGMRFGEASALEWGDVELEKHTIRIRRAVWRGVVDHPKAKASKRVVVIPGELVEVLRAHRAAMVRRQQTGVASALVFPSRRKSGSGYVTNGHAGKSVLRVLAKAEVSLGERPWVHSLRHTYNNLVRQNASELVRQALVGHADAEVGERYSKVTHDEKVEAVAKVLRMVRSAP